MQRYEFRVVPAPKKGKRAKGVKGPEGRFANALTAVMNEMAADGWDYIRSDTLPCEERSGLTSKTTVFQTMLVFRRPFDEAQELAGLIEDHSDETGETENLFDATEDDAPANTPDAPEDKPETRAAE